MKKYINPETKIVKIAAMQLLAGSEQMGVKGNYGSGEGITLGSRRSNSSWDDDEE